MTEPYWLEDERELRFASTALGGRVDVEIVGAGITGCAAARRLAEAGVRVRVREARRVAAGASGRSGGFALRGTAMRYDQAREALGPAEALALWQWTEQALARMGELGGDALRRTGSLRLAADPDELELVRAEYEALHADGFAADWLDTLPPALERTNLFHGGFVHPRDAALQPVRFVRRLAAAAAAAGAVFQEGAPVTALDALEADAILIATDGLTSSTLPELTDAIQPVRNQVIVTEPLEDQLFPLPHYARNGHAYWQQLENGRLLLGGFRDRAPAVESTDEDATTPVVQAALEEFLGELLGFEAGVERRWAGIFGVTPDLHPLVGRLPGRDSVWIAAGYSGHGNVLGFACGELVADAILGQADEQHLGWFDPARFISRRSA